LKTPTKGTIEQLVRDHPELTEHVRTEWLAKGVPKDGRFILLNTTKSSIPAEILHEGAWMPTTLSSGVPSLREGNGLRLIWTAKNGSRTTQAYMVASKHAYWIESNG
jgi:hypothetical protein